MTEYDAFGRKKGEDPLQGLERSSVELPGSAPSGMSPPAPAAPTSRSAGPVASPSPVPAPPAAPVLLRRRRRGRLGPVFALLVLLAVGSTLAAAVFGVTGSYVDGVTDVVVERAPPPEPAPKGSRPRRRAQGLAAGSLIRRDELAPAMARLRAAKLGAIVNLRVAADRIDVQLKTRDGRLRSVRIEPGRGAPRELALTDRGFEGVPALPVAAVNPAAAERLVRAASKRMRRPAGQVNYLVLLPLDKPTWGLFFKDGTHFQGDAAGRITRRFS